MTTTSRPNRPADDMAENVRDTVTDETRESETCGFEIRCGCCKTKRFRISIFSCFNNAKGALIFLCLASFLQGMITNGFYNIIVSTLERRFMLRSSETGFFGSAYDIAGCLSIPVITYVGGRGHKPLWLGSGVFLMGLGAIIFSLPHFLAPAYSIAETDSFVCDRTTDCGEASIRVYRGFFIVGQMLIGIGATPLYTLGITYLDENVEQAYSSLFHGIFYASALLGPGVGYILGGYLLSLFTNPDEQADITFESPLWIGNWWAGHLTEGILFILISIPILMYPKRIPGTEKVRLNRENEMHQNSDSLKVSGNQNFGMSIRDLPQSVRILAKNPTLMLISLMGSADSGLLIGIATFGPKYVESMFGLSASDAGLYFGIVVIATACSANVIGGLLITKMKLKVNQMIKLCIVSSVIAFASFFVFLYRCQNSEIVGVNVPYPGETESFCAQSFCGCSVDLYNPVCGANNQTYMSFCDAGCARRDANNFENCSRIGFGGKSNSTAKSGKCVTNSCPHLVLFLIFLGLAVFFTFFKSQSSIQISLRSVPFVQRSLSLGLQWIIVRIIGSIPVPIIFGKVLDLSCEVWKIECGECGSCQIYDNQTMAQRITILTTVLKGVSVLAVTIAMVSYKPPPSKNLASTQVEVSSHPASKNAEICLENANVFLSKQSPKHDNPAFIA